ncbi:hypothetical protein SeMB42_g02743 [Synchytrium endobioticum]|uniref:Beta-fructofuranosidase n=1 Tax=Synchytrium endobioticum TaxID=286115 RepID=A0A507DBS8_9FUNG|nr:hypothetical protein SeMB42_g02743 [Synchytrium endobioticum]
MPRNPFAGTKKTPAGYSNPIMSTARRDHIMFHTSVTGDPVLLLTLHPTYTTMHPPTRSLLLLLLSSSLKTALSTAIIIHDPHPSTNSSPSSNTNSFNNTRPLFHFYRPGYWISDPCAPYLDDDTGLYHLFYQQKGPSVKWWYDIDWGHAVSKDLLFWDDLEPAIVRGQPGEYDHTSVFSGFYLPNGYKSLPTIFYTGTIHGPINWALPYKPGYETQAMAYSTDKGMTWTKYGVVLPLPPTEYMNITSWRDPQVFQSTKLQTLLNYPKETHFMVVSGNDREYGPMMFLYSSTNLTSWSPLSIPFFDGPLIKTPVVADDGTVQTLYEAVATDIGTSLGFNFESGSYFELTDNSGRVYSFLTLGAEGGRDIKLNHWPLWVMGDVVLESSRPATTDKTVKFRMLANGVVDWGQYYATSGFPDGDKDLFMGWIGDADPDPITHDYIGRDERQWSGSLTVPRERFILTKEVIPLPDIPASWWSTSSRSTHGTTTLEIQTLGMKPADKLAGLHDKVYSVPTPANLHVRKSSDESEFTYITPPSLSSIKLDTFDMSVSFTVANASAVGIAIRKSPPTTAYNETEETLVYYDVDAAKIVVDRSKASLQDGGDVVKEEMNLRVMVDRTIVEVYVNDWAVLSTKIYPTRSDSTGLAFIAKGGDAIVTSCDVFTMKDIFPNRIYTSS